MLDLAACDVVQLDAKLMQFSTEDRTVHPIPCEAIRGIDDQRVNLAALGKLAHLVQLWPLQLGAGVVLGELVLASDNEAMRLGVLAHLRQLRRDAEALGLLVAAYPRIERRPLHQPVNSDGHRRTPLDLGCGCGPISSPGSTPSSAASRSSVASEIVPI